jgi:hypothetical protein
MKEINLHTAYDILQQCPAILLEGRLIEPTFLGLGDKDNNEFMCISWEEEYEDDVYTVELVFEEGDNEIVEIDGCIMRLISTDGEQEEITLLKEFYAETNQQINNT